MCGNGATRTFERMLLLALIGRKYSKPYKPEKKHRNPSKQVLVIVKILTWLDLLKPPSETVNYHGHFLHGNKSQPFKPSYLDSQLAGKKEPVKRPE